MTKRAIVSLATKNSKYVDGLCRLSNSLRDNADGIDFLGFIHERSVDAPLHSEHSYAFKVHAIQKAIDLDYDEILWLDASVWAVAPIHPIFDIISEQGYFFEGNGCYFGEWCNDKTLSYYKIDREISMELPMMQAAFMGFNMSSKIGKELFGSLNEAYRNYLFKGNWDNDNKSESNDERVKGHRHEQSCMSAILYLKGLNFSPVSEYVQYAGMYDKVENDKIIFKCQGV